jgi:hypothetical protein
MHNNKLNREGALYYTNPFFLFVYRYIYRYKRIEFLFLPLVVETKNSNLVLSNKYNSYNLITLNVIAQHYFDIKYLDSLLNITQLKLEELKYCYKASLIVLPTYRLESGIFDLPKYPPTIINKYKDIQHYCICKTLQTS